MKTKLSIQATGSHPYVRNHPRPKHRIPRQRRRRPLYRIEAYAEAMEDAVERRLDRYDAAKPASRAFRQAMPPPSGHENIRDFIACVAQGILMDVISGSDGARLLYAAQVAHSAMTPAPHSRKSTLPTESKLVPESKSQLL